MCVSFFFSCWTENGHGNVLIEMFCVKEHLSRVKLFCNHEFCLLVGWLVGVRVWNCKIGDFVTQNENLTEKKWLRNAWIVGTQSNRLFSVLKQKWQYFSFPFIKNSERESFVWRAITLNTHVVEKGVFYFMFFMRTFAFQYFFVLCF